MRLQLKSAFGGEARFVDCPQVVASSSIRLLPEIGDDLIEPDVAKTQDIDAIYFSEAFGRLVIKVPDHTRAKIRPRNDGSFEITFARNIAARAIGALLGRWSIVKFPRGEGLPPSWPKNRW